MASSSNYAGTSASSSTGTLVWTDANLAQGAPDAQAATQQASGTVGNNKYLEVTNFGFSIPDGATVVGVEAVITRAADVGDVIRTNTVQLITSAGTGVGDNKADASAVWADVEVDYEAIAYGGAADLWGTTFTPSQVNASGFGVRIRVVGALTHNAYIDAVQITITYTIGGVVGQQSADGSWNVQVDGAGSGVYAANGSIRINTSASNPGLYAPDGAFRGVISDDAGTPAPGVGRFTPTGALRLTSSGSTRYSHPGLYAKDGSIKVTVV